MKKTMKKAMAMMVAMLMVLTALCVSPVSVSAADDGYVWVVRDYELKESQFTAITSDIHVQLWWQFWLADQSAAFDVSVKEIQIWIDGEMLDTHMATGDSPIEVEGENEGKPTVERNSSGVTVKKGTVCKYTQLQYAVASTSSFVMADTTVTVKVLVKVGDAVSEWPTDNAFNLGFWGSGISGFNWMAQTGEDGSDGTIVKYDECRNGTPGYNDPSDPGSDNPPTPATADYAPAVALILLGTATISVVVKKRKTR